MPTADPPLDTARLRHLATKSTLTNLERLELDDLLLRQSSLRIAKQRTGVAGSRRKLENRLKFRLGALALQAGLANWSDDELLGVFAAAAKLTATQRANYGEQGARLARAPDPRKPLKGDFQV